MNDQKVIKIPVYAKNLMPFEIITIGKHKYLLLEIKKICGQVQLTYSTLVSGKENSVIVDENEWITTHYTF